MSGRELEVSGPEPQESRLSHSLSTPARMRSEERADFGDGSEGRRHLKHRPQVEACRGGRGAGEGTASKRDKHGNQEHLRRKSSTVLQYAKSHVRQ